jgi:hypothetical protein
VREVTAETARESRAILEAEGCTELVLISDEVADAVHTGFRRAQVGREENKTTAEARLEARVRLRKYGKSFGSVARDSLVNDIGLYMLILLLLGMGITLKRADLTVYGCIALVVWPAFRIWSSLPGVYHRKLNKAREWHDWPEVFQLIEKLQMINGFHFTKIPAETLARTRAIALAGTGKLSQAVEEYRRYENQPGVPGWLYKAHLASILDSARQHDAAIQLSEAAVAERPTATLAVDLAFRRLRRKKDVGGAREALKIAEQGELIEIGKPHLLRCHGIIAYLEGNNAEARKNLEAALAILKTTPHQPFIEANTALTKAYLACALARLGDMAAARKMFADAKEYLVAAEETELLAECNRVVT